MGLFHKNPKLEAGKAEREKIESEFKQWKHYTGQYVTYIGGVEGFPKQFENSPIFIDIYDGGINFSIGPGVATDYNYYHIFVPIGKIVNSTQKDETQLQKDITFTRMLTLGIFAFAAPKTTKTGYTYLTINYKGSDDELIQAVFRNEVNRNSAISLLSIDILRAKKKYLNG